MDPTKQYETWDAFLKAWPLKRLEAMTLPEYTAAGNADTFTAWLEQRLDKVGSIWGGSAFKFGIYSRRDKAEKHSGRGISYSAAYAWYSKYGSSPDEAFAAVKGLVNTVAQAAARGDFAAIDGVDLGKAYKWKIAFHYQDRHAPGVLAAFKRKRLQQWLTGRVGQVPNEMSALYRAALAQNTTGLDLLAFSAKVWTETDPDDEEESSDDELVDVPVEVFPGQPLNQILYGPPGTGKTYATAKLAVGICDGKIPPERELLMRRYRELKHNHRIRFVTFHPSFTYEEFVEGIRPSTEDGQVRYDVRAGIFKKAVNDARALYEKNGATRNKGLAPSCVLVIDEINRANLAKTFGELITLLEPSKRIGEPDEQETELPYSGDRFGIPPNLYVVGTMNTADRSIALLDVALRRRFHFCEMAPEPDLLPEDVAGVNLRALLKAMNARIESLIDRDHMLGHTYLMGMKSFDDIATGFRTQIIPLLQEYFFDDWGRIQQVFNDQNQPAEQQIVQKLPKEGATGLGDRPRYRLNGALSPAAIQKIYE